MCYTADMAATRLDQAVMEASPKWALRVRQAEGPFVVFLLDWLYLSVELFANFCSGLLGIFWDFFLLTSYDPCALDLSPASNVGQSWYSM